VTPLIAVALFAVGVVVVVVATERLLEGLVDVAAALRIAPFVASAVLSGLEAENIAVGLAAGQRGAADIALGTTFGGAMFVLCIALGLGALIAPLEARLPRGVVLLIPAAATWPGYPSCSARRHAGRGSPSWPPSGSRWATSSTPPAGIASWPTPRSAALVQADRLRGRDWSRWSGSS
jgi:hypothetical protein